MTKGTEIRYRVRGGTPLQGTVFIQGAKNAALKMIAASLLADKGRTVLRMSRRSKTCGARSNWPRPWVAGWSSTRRSAPWSSTRHT